MSTGPEHCAARKDRSHEERPPLDEIDHRRLDRGAGHASLGPRHPPPARGGEGCPQGRPARDGRTLRPVYETIQMAGGKPPALFPCAGHGMIRSGPGQGWGDCRRLRRQSDPPGRNRGGMRADPEEILTAPAAFANLPTTDVPLCFNRRRQARQDPCGSLQPVRTGPRGRTAPRARSRPPRCSSGTMKGRPQPFGNPRPTVSAADFRHGNRVGIRHELRGPPRIPGATGAPRFLSQQSDRNLCQIPFTRAVPKGRIPRPLQPRPSPCRPAAALRNPRR